MEECVPPVKKEGDGVLPN